MSHLESMNVATSFVTTVSRMQSPETLQLRRDFGQWIRERREQLKFSQDGVADKIGVDRQTIYRIEGGLSGTKRNTVVAIAQALSLNVDEALIRSGQAVPSANGADTGFFKGLEKLSPENRQAVRRAMQALIDSLAEREETDADFDYVDDDEEPAK